VEAVMRKKPNYKSAGGVYFATASTLGLTKIGCSTQLASRVEQLRAFCPDHKVSVFSITHDEPRSFESYFHERFRHLRQHGEWFALSSGDLQKVREENAELVREIVIRLRGTVEDYARNRAMSEMAVPGDKWTLRRELAIAHWSAVSHCVAGEIDSRNALPPEIKAVIRRWIDSNGYGQFPRSWHEFIEECAKSGNMLLQVMNRSKSMPAYQGDRYEIPCWGYVTPEELVFDAVELRNKSA